MEDFMSGGKTEKTGNPQYVQFHMRHELVKPFGWYSTEHHDKEGRLCGQDDNTIDALPLTITTTLALQEIPGIKSVSARPYTFSILKGEAFTWDEMMPQIKLVMSKYLPAKYS